MGNIVKISVGILDDHHIFRSGLIHLINQTKKYHVLFETDAPEKIFEYDNLNKIEILILDISLPHTSGLLVLEKLKEINFNGKIIILSMFDEKEYGIQSIQGGANGYLSKNVASEELINCLNSVQEGRLYMSPSLSTLFTTSLKEGFKKPPHNDLSKREKEVLFLLAEGYRPIDIAKKLFLSIKTVSAYKVKIFNALQLKNQSELVFYCIKQGIITTPLNVK